MSPYYGVLLLVLRRLETKSLCWILGMTQTPGLAITPEQRPVKVSRFKVFLDCLTISPWQS